MNCEVEFLPVGDGSKAGDAIVIRYGTPASFELMVVDGGSLDSGKLLVDHVQRHYGSQAVISHAILTHSDADHASGLREVLRVLPVMNLWLHIPWPLAVEARHLFHDKRWTDAGLRDAIKKEYDIVSEIVDLAITRGCKLFYPFEGQMVGPFRVLSPSRDAYLHLLPQFDKTPAPDQALLESRQMWLGKQQPPNIFAQLLEKAVAKVQAWVPESWHMERLRDSGATTSASNETSVVLYGSFDNNHRILLTGDAGVNALHWAADSALAAGLPLCRFSLVQIPHHGSRRNVGPTILNRLFGPIQPEGSTPHFAAFVSAPQNGATHPRKMVVNAFIRRGARVIATQGYNKVHWGGFPMRPGYVNAEVLPFAAQVEDYD